MEVTEAARYITTGTEAEFYDEVEAETNHERIKAALRERLGKKPRRKRHEKVERSEAEQESFEKWKKKVINKEKAWERH